MSEISRISPSEVKPSVGEAGKGVRGRTQTLNTGQHGHNTDTHQRGTAGPDVPGSVGAGKVLWGQDGAEGGAGGLKPSGKGLRISAARDLGIWNLLCHAQGTHLGVGSEAGFWLLVFKDSGKADSEGRSRSFLGFRESGPAD